MSAIILFAGLNRLEAQGSCTCAAYENRQVDSGPEREKLIGELSGSKDLICLAYARELRAVVFVDQGKPDSADLDFRAAEILFRKTGCDDSLLRQVYKNRAQVFYERGDFAKAQEFSFKFLETSIKSGNLYEQANAYTMIAQLFNQTNQADRGIQYTRLAIPLLDQIKQAPKRLDILFKLSKRFLWYYQDTKAPGSLDSSRQFSLAQLSLARQTGNTRSMATAFNNLQGIEWEKQEYAHALAFLDSSFHYSDPDDYAVLATNYFDRADLLLQMGKFDEAKRMADSSMALFHLDSNVAFIADTYELLARIAREKGDYRAAYENREAGRAITDSIRDTEKSRQVTELEKKYNQARNEQTIRELAQQKQIYLLIAIAGLLVAVVIGFYLRQQALRHRQKILETEQRLNRARMNPHFFFNALASLQRFALEENDGKTLASNLSKFSRIMRESLESTYKEYVTVEQEIDFLTEYLKLQQLRFPGKFVFGIEAADDLEPDEVLIPSTIIQPFVENSIEHGFSGISYAGSVTVLFGLRDKELMVQVQDNGKGLAPAPGGADHVSRASQIIRDRIYLLNLKLKTRAGFSIDNTPGKPGVTVKIHLPLLRKHEIAADR